VLVRVLHVVHLDAAERSDLSEKLAPITRSCESTRRDGSIVTSRSRIVECTLALGIGTDELAPNPPLAVDDVALRGALVHVLVTDLDIAGTLADWPS
jgi:hypothetical protein